ncbi:MAG: hypothetical protein AAGD13_02730 [Pseudomonadota bacterium]
MPDFTSRPPKPAPLDLLSEESREEWRAWLTDCGLADNPAPVVRDAKPEPKARPQA